MVSGRTIVVAALGATQTIAWASSYYMPAILGAPIAAALQLPSGVFFGLFSAALLFSLLLRLGRLQTHDRFANCFGMTFYYGEMERPNEP